MPPKLPPPAQKKSNSQSALFQRMVARYHVNRQVAADVLFWAKREQVDPIYVLSVMMAESGANPRVHNSSAGAIGIMQVMPGMHDIPWGQGKATAQWLKSYSNNIRLGIYLLAQAVHQVGYSKAYSGVRGVSYNYGGGTPYAKYTPKGYLYGSGGAGGAGIAPEASVANSVGTAQAKAGNPYLQGQAFADMWHNRIDPIWEAYTGKRATRGQAIAVIKAGWSDYHLELSLSKSKSFIGSPVWESKAPGYKEVYKSIQGENAKVPTDFIRYGIVHNLDATGFEELIRKSKNYVHSNEFKTNTSTLENIYRTIYGAPDQKGLVTIQRAVLNGWSQDQFAKFLRSQPEYSKSQEWGDQVSGLLDTLGGITGQGVVMSPGSNIPAPAGKAAPPPKKDNRVKGNAGVGVQGPQYKVGLNG